MAVNWQQLLERHSKKSRFPSLCCCWTQRATIATFSSISHASAGNLEEEWIRAPRPLFDWTVVLTAYGYTIAEETGTDATRVLPNAAAIEPAREVEHLFELRRRKRGKLASRRTQKRQPATRGGGGLGISYWKLRAYPRRMQTPNHDPNDSDGQQREREGEREGGGGPPTSSGRTSGAYRERAWRPAAVLLIARHALTGRVRPPPLLFLF
jgi:hypothetical protein